MLRSPFLAYHRGCLLSRLAFTVGSEKEGVTNGGTIVHCKAEKGGGDGKEGTIVHREEEEKRNGEAADRSRGANLATANLFEADFTRANLSAANLSAADL